MSVHNFDSCLLNNENLFFLCQACKNYTCLAMELSLCEVKSRDCFDEQSRNFFAT